MELVHHLKGRLLFAVPKKGRLQKAALDILAGSDIQFHRENRLDIALVKNLDIALVFLPAAEIPAYVAEGRVGLGITGRDVVAEYLTSASGRRANAKATANGGGSNGSSTPPDGGSAVEEIMDLEFGRCRLMVQVPEGGALQEPRDLIGKNVVTSFDGLTERYFAQLEGIEVSAEELAVDEFAVKRKLKTRIEYASGSVEAACPLGRADGIVDLVESGETMKAAGLTDIGTVLESTAVLIKSPNVTEVELVQRITKRIKGVINAKSYVMCQYNIHRSGLEKACKITPGKRAPTITGLEEKDWVAVSVMVHKREIANVMDELDQIGAADILELSIANSRAH